MKAIQQIALAVTLTMTVTAQAETFWTNTDLQYLAGSNYLNPFKDTETDGTVITFEHAGAYNWGKSFSFIDIFETDDKAVLNNDTYIELGVDVSLTGGKGFKGVVKDIYLATQLENGSAAGVNFSNLLGGVGLRWNIPGFAFFDTNLYYRNNDLSDDNMQLTTAWSLPFSMGPVAMTFDGFLDMTDSIDSDNDFGGQALFHMQPQLKLDIGHFWQQSNKYYVGVEVDYWKNKFGVKDADQTAVQAMVQINF